MKERIMNNLDRIVNSLVAPETTFQDILENKKAITGIYFYIFFVAFLGFMSGALVGNFILGIVVAILFIIIGLVKLLVWSGISHIIAKFVFHGKGQFVQVFELFGYMSVAFILGIVALALLVLGSIFAALLLLVLMIVWMCILAIVALDTVHEIGVGRAFLSIIGIPALIIIILFVILGVL